MNNSITRLNIKLQLRHLRNSYRFFSQTIEKKIEIPKRIPRGPTDILQALAATIKQDPTAAHYKYHDDPYLTPMSNIGKRTFAMAQEAGRKAAHWIRQEHADLFQHQNAEPAIKLFMPAMVFNENSEVSEDILKSVIKEAQVSNAVAVYKLLEKNKVKLSQDTLQDLLELLCFYNNEDTLSEEFTEERWFRAGAKGADRPRKSWKDGDLAETVFISIENPGSAAYCALIQGMTKYYQVDRAWEIYEEAKQKRIPLTTQTYNSLICVANFRKEGYEFRWQLIEELLSCMVKEGLKPDTGTLNATLEVLSTMPGFRKTRNYMLQALAEFKQVGIEPSLGSWYYILITFCRERSKTSYILHDIMNYIEGKEFKIVDLKDTYFFVTAMDICRNHLSDKDLSYRVDQLLHTGNNYDLIGDSYKESIYYRHQFALLCAVEPLEVFMEYYKKMVPNIYIPEPSIMIEVLKAIEINEAIEYIPKIWSDMVLFDHTDRENLLITILHIMVSNTPPQDSELHQHFSRIAWDIWNKIEHQPIERIRKLNFTGDMVGNIMILCLRGNNFENADIVMNKLENEPFNISGIPKLEALKLFVEHCVKQNLPSKAINCIQYCAENGFDETENLARYVNEAFTLSEIHIAKLTSIFGKDTLFSETTPPLK